MKGVPLSEDKKPFSSMHLRRLRLVVLGGLLVSFVVLTAVAVRWLEIDRSELIQRFSEDRLAALSEIAGEVEQDMEDITDDLLFATRIVESGADCSASNEILEAMLSTAKAYSNAVVYDRHGALKCVATDPRRGGPLSQEVLGLTERTVADALANPKGGVQVSPLLPHQDRWIRVFAAKLYPDTSTDIEGALALLVDMKPYTGRLRLAAADPQTLLLVLGPQGHPAPVSSPRFLGPSSDQGIPGGVAPMPYQGIVGRINRQAAGTLRVTEREAAGLGLGRAEVIVSHAPIQLDPTLSWTVATFSSLAALKEHDTFIITRMSLVLGGIALALGSLGTFVMVSSRRRAVLQERLRHLDEVAHLNEKARKILDTIPIFVLAVSSDGQVTDVNRTASERLDRTLGQGTLAAVFAQSPKAGIERIEALVREAQTSRITSSITGEKMALFGREGYYSVHAVPLHPPSEDAELLLMIEDLTGLKSLETQLLASEKLATVGVLAAGIAHEIGTPLGVVRGRAEYILTKLDPSHPHAAGLKVIVDQVDRVVRTIKSLLDFSRPKPATMGAVDVVKVIGKCVDFLQFEAQKRKLSLAVATVPNLPLAAADSDQLEQVLVNLVMNAFDASGPGRQVRITAAPDTADGASRNGRCLRIEVADEGAGIPEAHLLRVFDPFFSTKKRGQSTGLGLTMVSQIVRSHNARIQLHSTPDRGTRVVLIWPAAPTEERLG